MTNNQRFFMIAQLEDLLIEKNCQILTNKRECMFKTIREAADVKLNESRDGIVKSIEILKEG